MSESGEVTSSLSVSNESSSSATAPPSGKSIDQKFQVLLSCVGKLPDQVNARSDWPMARSDSHPTRLRFLVAFDSIKFFRKSLTRP